MSTTVSRLKNKIIVDSDTIDLTTLISIAYVYIGFDGFIHSIITPKSEFLTQTTTEITFILPDPCRFFDEPISVTFTGIQFSGSVPLGILSILYANASGMYKITVNKTNDTIYGDSSISPETHDVKIPNPFAKTGYVGG